MISNAFVNVIAVKRVAFMYSLSHHFVLSSVLFFFTELPLIFLSHSFNLLITFS